jgi:cytochrome bd ubiquinol oxidase subunit II
VNAPIDFVGVWTLILGVGIFFYVLLDGFDLGIGILYAFAPSPEARPVMMASVAPVWDGNQTWLVLGAVALLAEFPLAFAILVPALYFPFLAVLVGLAFRGVAFEFRFKDPLHRAFWDTGFFLGSTVATIAQGMVIGAFIQGFRVEGRAFVGSSWDWLTPFSGLTGFGLLAGYALLGACWLVMKAEGPLQEWARRQAMRCLLASLVVLGAISVWTPLTNPAIAIRWFSWPNIAWLSPVPLLTLLVALWAWWALRREREIAPFVAAILLFLLAYIGIAISLWPLIVPPRYSLWDAAASPSTESFLLVGTLFLLPVILLYTGWSYWVFRGKVRADVGYH